jgi:hypothetical protein
MVFLVDTTGDGVTDHFVPVIGYDDGPPQRYIYFNTWDLDPHQAEFREMSSAYTWGIMIAWSFDIENINAFRLAQASHGDRYEEGNPLSLSVTVAGATGQVAYQWSKNGTDLPGETGASFEIAALTELDEGWYQCRVTDESKALLESPPAFVGVYPAGSMPAAGGAGIVLMLLACCWLGSVHLRHGARRAMPRS